MLQFVIESSLVIAFFFASMQEGMIFAFVPTYVRPVLWEIAIFLTRVFKLKVCTYTICETLAKPLFECMTCMTSVWGISIWFITGHGFDWLIIPYLLMLGGANALIGSIINRYP